MLICKQTYTLQMGRPAVLRGALLIAVYALLYSATVRAQLPRNLERCLPYPTLADEIGDMYPNIPGPPPARIVVESVTFDPATDIPSSVRRLLAASVKRSHFEARDGWIDVLQEVVVLGVLQNRGYFRAKANAEAQALSSDPMAQHVSITLHVETGLQYRLGNVRFRESNPTQLIGFPTEELRKLIPLHDGELFRVERIRQGLNALKEFYNAHGYIDFVATPLTEADDTNRRISLTVELQEQKQYRVGRIEILSSDSKIRGLLTSKIKEGSIVNMKLIDDLYRENKSILPPDSSSADVWMARDVKAGVVNFSFNFLTCPQPQP